MYGINSGEGKNKWNYKGCGGNRIMSKDEYLITDTPLKALTVFAMPMILGSFFQQIYNMADSVIVGQFVGSSALAAVGACAALTNVFICVALGAGVGAGVLVTLSNTFIFQSSSNCNIFHMKNTTIRLILLFLP